MNPIANVVGTSNWIWSLIFAGILSPIVEEMLFRGIMLNKIRMYGDKVAIISVGKMVQYAMLANEVLIEEGINPTIISASFIKPLDLEILKELVENNYDIITVEDNVGNGGFGSYVIESLYNLGFKGKFKSLSYKDEFIPHGKVDLLYSEYGLDSVAIKNTVITMIK